MPAGGQLDVAFLKLGEAQQLQRFGDGEEFVDLHLQAVGERRQIGAAIVGIGGDLLDHAGERIGRDLRQRHGDAEARESSLPAWRRGLRPFGHQRIDLVDELAELGIEPIARMR